MSGGGRGEELVTPQNCRREEGSGRNTNLLGRERPGRGGGDRGGDDDIAAACASRSPSPSRTRRVIAVFADESCRRFRYRAADFRAAGFSAAAGLASFFFYFFFSFRRRCAEAREALVAGFRRSETRAF